MTNLVRICAFVVLLSLTFTAQTGFAEDLRIGALLTQAKNVDPDTHVALKIAVKDFNEAFAQGQTPTVAKLEVEDTEGSPERALKAIRQYAARGIHIVIGPETSDEAAAIRDTAKELGIVLVSHCSTAPSLASRDHLFRLVPDDRQEARALAARLHSDGIKVLFPLWRAGLWGDDFEKALRASFVEFGGVVKPGLRLGLASKAGEALDLLAQQVSEENAKGSTKAAVAFLMFGNSMVEFFTEAAQRPSLVGARWYGTEGTAVDRNFLKDVKAAQFAIKTRYTTPIFAPALSPKVTAVQTEIRKELPGSIHACAYTAYDAFMVGAFTGLATRHDQNLKTIQNVLPFVANQFYGLTGWTRLNADGDRAQGAYDFWHVKELAGKFEWEKE